MTAGWVGLTDGLGDVDESSATVTVALDQGRQHRVEVAAGQDDWVLRGLSADTETMVRIGLGPGQLWERNRGRRITGFMVDAAGVWVTATVPQAGTSSEEFQLVAREVAREADALEFWCSGTKDRW
jgi:hypothetical protein